MEQQIRNRQAARDDIQSQISKFLLDGGKIQVCKPPMDLRHETKPVGMSHLSVEV